MAPLKAFMARAPKGWAFEIQRKSIRHIYFRVYPAQKTVRASVPARVSDQQLAQAVQSRASWLLRQMGRPGPVPVPGLGSYGPACVFQGRPYPLSVLEKKSPPKVVFNAETGFSLYVRPGTLPEKQAQILENWFRLCLKTKINNLAAHWEPKIGVKASDFRVRQMTTRWGSCNTRAGRIWINLALIHLPPCYLEYVLVHELIHLIEPRHNPRFYRLLAGAIPEWQGLRQSLNAYSLREPG